MSNNFKHGDIFYVTDGSWDGIYLNYDGQPYIYTYDSHHIYNLMYYKNFNILRLYQNIIKVEEDTLKNLNTEYKGNIFEISKNNIAYTKEEYEEALYNHYNIRSFFTGDDKLWAVKKLKKLIIH